MEKIAPAVAGAGEAAGRAGALKKFSQSRFWLAGMRVHWFSTGWHPLNWEIFHSRLKLRRSLSNIWRAVGGNRNGAVCRGRLRRGSKARKLNFRLDLEGLRVLFII